MCETNAHNPVNNLSNRRYGTDGGVEVTLRTRRSGLLTPGEHFHVCSPEVLEL